MMPAPWAAPPRRDGGVVIAMFAIVSVLIVLGIAILQARFLLDFNQIPNQQTFLLMGVIGNLLVALGVSLALPFGAYVGVKRDDLPEGVRRAALLGPMVLAGLWLLAVLRPSTQFLP